MGGQAPKFAIRKPQGRSVRDHPDTFDRMRDLGELLPHRVRAIIEPARARAERTSADLQGRVRSPLHQTWLGAVLGLGLGVAFTVCFLTGLVDYLAQHPPGWFHLPTHPADLYRVTEGVHVVTGIATIPLLLAKLWVVWPNLFKWPPVRGLANGLERLSLIPLVGGSLFLLFTGVVNIDYWYSPMGFTFTTAHFWTAWMVVGALIVHIGAKAATTRDALRPDLAAPVESVPAVPVPEVLEPARPAPEPAGATGWEGFGRRGFLGVVGATAAVLVLTVVGETVAPLRRLAVLAPRNPSIGPQHVPVNQTAVQAEVTRTAADPDYRLVVSGRCRSPRSFSLAELQGLPERESALPITCVEGWSADATWGGVSMPVLLASVGAPSGATVRVQSLESADRLYSSSVVDAEHAADPDTLLALRLNGAELDLDHGYPVRLIAPDRPGVLQTKWLAAVVVR